MADWVNTTPPKKERQIYLEAVVLARQQVVYHALVSVGQELLLLDDVIHAGDLVGDEVAYQHAVLLGIWQLPAQRDVTRPDCSSFENIHLAWNCDGMEKNKGFSLDGC